jgi:DNA-binding Lrp family transcriptional regulator
MDAIDQRIISILRNDGRITNADLAENVGLSPSACLRRVRLLEESGTIRGYSALINDRAAAPETVVIVQITLERQTDEYLRRFEKAACQCPDIRECYLIDRNVGLPSPCGRARRGELRAHSHGRSILPAWRRPHPIELRDPGRDQAAGSLVNNLGHERQPDGRPGLPLRGSAGCRPWGQKVRLDRIL